jgi:hypothetical protein
MRIHVAAGATLIGLLAAGCEPKVDPPPSANAVVARFDPLGTPPVVPTPNDLALQGGNGFLNVADQPTDSAAQKAFNAYLRTLTGFPASSAAAASFSGKLDLATVTLQTASKAGSLVVVDTTSGALLGADQLVTSLSADGTGLSVSAKSRWTPGHRYALMLFGNVDPVAVKGDGGKTVLAAPVFFFLSSPTPVLARCADPSNAACVCPAEAIADPNDTTCTTVARGLTREQAKTLEPQRVMLDAALKPLLSLFGAGHERSNLVLFWSFTITTQPMAVFDPTSGAVPFPNDALIDQKTGHVALPIAEGDPQAALKQQLNTLDGFSTSAALSVPVDLAAGDSLDATTIADGKTVNLAMLIDATTPPLLQKTVALAAGSQIVAQPTNALVPDQRRYATVVTRAIKDAKGQEILPAPTTVLVLQPNPLVDDAGKSNVNVLGDAQAAQLEALRQALAPLVAGLSSPLVPPEIQVTPDRIAALWTFTTQSIERPLAALDAYPTQKKLSTDVDIKVYKDFSKVPADFLPLFAPIGAVVEGTFQTQLVYDPKTRAMGFTRTPLSSMPTVPQADVFSVTPPATPVTATVSFWLTIPVTGPAGDSTTPVTIVQHGLTSWRGDVFQLSSDLAAAGRASIGFDIDFHGSRTKCSADNMCQGGAAGSCNTATGQCTGGLAHADPTTSPGACLLYFIRGDEGDASTDCRPLASGNGYVDPANLFGGRAVGGQYVVDASQVVRILADTMNANGLHAKLATAAVTPVLRTSEATPTVSFLGQSLGAINGSLFLATDPRVDVGVLNVGGGHIFEILADGGFKDSVDAYLKSIGVTRGSPAYQQIVQTARWVLDPVDPYSVARTIVREPSFSYLTQARNASKLAIVQSAGMDTVIPTQYERALSYELLFPNGLDGTGNTQGKGSGADFVSTYFPTAQHSDLLKANTMRTQAITFITSNGATVTAP